jgi:malonate decarboxylase gamma subunit
VIPEMRWTDVATALFPGGFEIAELGDFLRGRGRLGTLDVAVAGTTNHGEMGVELALSMADAVLDVVRAGQARPLLFLIDTSGQRLRRRDELLGIHRYLAHLAKTVDLARRRGHRVVGLIYGQALSGGFLPNAMMSDLCAALPQSEIRVMGLSAMAKVMRISEERLRELGRTSPVFAPGPDNFAAMGAVDTLWNADLAACLLDALNRADPHDRRAEVGLARGGRTLAYPVAVRVATDGDGAGE